jgi:hypothetical protein
MAHGVLGVSSARRRNGRPPRRRAGGKANSQKPRAASVGGVRRGSRGNGQVSVDRDALLAAIFPQGIPPRENVIRAVNSWLDEAERLARMR